MLELSQVISQIIAFLIMLWILKKFAWKRILSILDERQKRIQNEFDQIAKQKEDLKQISEEYQNKLYRIKEKTNQIMNEAQKKGREHAKELLLEAQGQAKGIVNKALLDAENESHKVKNTLKNEMAGEAILLTEKLIRKKFDPEEQKTLARDLLDEAKLS